MRTPSPPGLPLAARLRLTATTIGAWIAVLFYAPRRGRPPIHLPERRRLFLLATLAAVIAIGGAMIVFDNPVRLWVQSVSPVPQIFYDISDFGRSSWILIPAAILIVVAAWINSGRLSRLMHGVLAASVVRLGFVFIAVGLPGLIVTIVKRWIGRVRPSELGPFAYEPLSWKPAFASLPSGHATTAFAALVAIGLVAPRLRPVLWVYAVAVAISRVAISAHYLSDVLAGAAVGTLGAFLVRNAFASRRLGFIVGSDGFVHTMPGPSFSLLRRLARAASRP